MSTSKKCKAECKLEKSLSEFRRRQRGGRWYYESYCKKCERNRNIERLKKRYQNYKEEYRKRNAEKKEERTQYMRKYRANNKAKIREYNKNIKNIDTSGARTNMIQILNLN